MLECIRNVANSSYLGTGGQKQKRIDEFIEKLGLFSCQNVLVKRLSAGERRCTAIATTLITDKKLVFLDGPTNNLSH